MTRKDSSQDNRTQKKPQTRRRFLMEASLGVAGSASALKIPLVHAAGASPDKEIKIGLIGCGGRGAGAVMNAVGAATRTIYPQSGYHTEDVAEGARVQREGIRVVAMADLFEDRWRRTRKELSKLGIEVPEKNCFTGFDAYQRVLADPVVNYVIHATPPHFRPAHLLDAIRAGKHVFMEKPAAVDVPGVKQVMEAGELARQKGLGIAAGTQRRHDKAYCETIQRIRDGAIGEIIFAKCYWNGGQIWVVDRKPEWSDLEWQLRNWNYFTWLSGDHYVEQHVHNLDIMNWVLGAHPVRAVSGIGGRQVRVGARHGHVFDHFSVEFEYPGGIPMFSQARQINGCDNKVGEEVVGSAGRSNCRDRISKKDGSNWRFREKKPSSYEMEHEHLIASILAGNPINEAQALAESTMTGILGREAAYSGKTISWDQAMQSTTRLGPDRYELGPYPIPEVAKPGLYRFS